MNWVEYLEHNYHVTDPYDAKQVYTAAKWAATILKCIHGWKDFTIGCTPTSLYFAYSKGSGLYTAFIPVSLIAKELTIRPILERIVKMHEKEDTYRKTSRKV